ncbi:aminotransferase class IV [Pseudodesulfovibrio tunisiensis]|uniref:aminotransferase class IV n=1 Tax=Pseudodesulfovibrio tunisiensis TaxID=463192 RepID=UPI001FB1D230|nr:aminotransferase class IV [Pseudodesulfovibrio tunisiensis]
MIHYRDNGFHEGPVPMDPTAPAFRFGTGFFETIYYNGTRLCLLDAHLDRLLGAFRAYGLEYETVDFPAVCLETVKRNQLADRPARVNIFYPVEDGPARPVILAAPYEPSPHKTFRLCVCNDRHVSTLAHCKTMSHMFYHLAWTRARARGFDDAAILDFHDHLLETGTASLLFERDGAFFEPESRYKLAGTAIAVARRMLDIAPVQISLDALPEYDHAYVLNSLTGMRPVVSIGETAFVPADDTCKQVTREILG